MTCRGRGSRSFVRAARAALGATLVAAAGVVATVAAPGALAAGTTLFNQPLNDKTLDSPAASLNPVPQLAVSQTSHAADGAGVTATFPAPSPAAVAVPYSVMLTATASALTVVSTASTGTTTPGATVSYTITATNAGKAGYSRASLADSLAGALDDATFNHNAVASAGRVSYGSPDLTWTGNLPAGATVTITFSMRVKTSPNGDKILATSVTSPTANSNCASGSRDPRCANSVSVLSPGLRIAASAASGTTAPGAVVHYRIKVTNSGQTALTGASFTDRLGGVLDDASYGSDASATRGSVTYSAPNLTWSGNLATGTSATVTFSVTVNSPDSGNKLLASTVTSPTTGSNCPAGGAAAACTVSVKVASLTIVNSASTGSARPGGTVRFTVTFTNTGQTPYTGITISAATGDVFDDATANGDQTASAGTLATTGTGISWTGDIAVGQTVTVTGTVTVNNPDTGNKLLAATITTAAAGSNCPVGGRDPRCSVSVAVLVPGLSITQAANTTAARPGQRVTITVTIADTGQTPYTGAVVADEIGDSFDDAAYDNNATATTGTLGYAASTGTITWTGRVSPGGSAGITYSLTVKNPDSGDKLLLSDLSSPTTGSNCPQGNSDPACILTIPVRTQALTIATTANTATAVPGQVITYTITITDTGQIPYTGATVTNDLTDVIDAAAYNHDAATTSGTLTFTTPNLTWTGNLTPGDTATITYTATVNKPDTGSATLTSTLTSRAPGSNCPAGTTDPRCAIVIDVAVLSITNEAAVSSVTPGSQVRYTVIIRNGGQVPYARITLTDNLTGTVRDAQLNDDGETTTGRLVYTAPDLTWTGTLLPGASDIISYSVTVTNPSAGGTKLTSTITSSAAGSTCPPASHARGCIATVTIVAGTLALTVPASANLRTGALGAGLAGNLGPVQVTDTWGTGASWTATVSAGAFSPGKAAARETIPPGDMSYDIGDLAQSSGPAMFSYERSVVLGITPRAVVSATDVGGDTSATWDPLISVNVPASAVAGPYAGVITESVS
jgi:large repetitive protein